MTLVNWRVNWHEMYSTGGLAERDAMLKSQNSDAGEIGGETGNAVAVSGISRRSVLSGIGVGIVGSAGVTLTQGWVPAYAQSATLGEQIPIDKIMAVGTLPDNVQGSADAKVTVIEYSSMTCPHCARFHNDVLGDFKKKYIETGKVRYIVREFPLSNLATAASMLARCAGPDKYFAFVDALYAQQEKWAFGGNPVPPLRALAKQAGFTRESFDACLNDKKLVDGILWIHARASKEFQVRSTPTFFINGRKLRGNYDFRTFEYILDPMLNS